MFYNKLKFLALVYKDIIFKVLSFRDVRTGGGSFLFWKPHIFTSGVGHHSSNPEQGGSGTR